MRIHFFRKKFTDFDDIYRIQEIEEAESGIYLGNIVCRPLSTGAIGRTTINAKRIPHPPFYACMAKYEVNILGSRLIVDAFPFISQDTDISQCAQAALWMTLRYYSRKYDDYKEILSYDVSHLSKDYRRGRMLPTKGGLTIQHLSEALSNYGFSPGLYIKEFHRKAGKEELFYRILYYYIESGIPLIVGVKNHALTVFGHINSSIYTQCDKKDNCEYAKGALASACCYNKAFVVNDDNHLPYEFVLKRNVSLPDEDKEFSAKSYCIEDIESFVVPLHEKIYLPAEKVDDLAQAIILKHSRLSIFKMCKEDLSQEELVIRMFLTSSRSYKYFRRANPVPGIAQKMYLNNPLPKFIWIAEISTKKLYECESPKIIGEAIFDATANQNDRNSFIYIHYPGILKINDRYVCGDHRLPVDSGVDGVIPYQLYRNNLQYGGR